MFVEFHFRRHLTYVKTLNFAILYLTPFRPAHLGGPSTSGRPQIKKITERKIEINKERMNE